MSMSLSARKPTFIISFVLLLACTPILMAAETQARPGEKPLVFGFLPILSTTRLLQRFTPLVEYLSKETGREIRIETAPDYREFLRRTNIEKRYDIVFTAPHFYYLAEHRAGYEGLVRVNLPTLRAVIVVPRNSPIRTVSELSGRRLATVDPLALGTFLVRDHLKKNGLNPDRDLTLVPSPTHNASLLAAYRGNTDAASLMIPPYKRANREVRERMRILATTEGTPHMAFATAGRLDPALKKKLTDAMIKLGKTPEGKALLKKLLWPGFVPISKNDYAILESVVSQMPLE